MSKKHFTKFAEAICQITDTAERKRTADLVGLVCSETNVNFNWLFWYKSCGVS